MSDMVRAVGVDKTCYSLSFNEYLSLVSLKRREEPRDTSLLASFRYFLYSVISSIFSFTVCSIMTSLAPFVSRNSDKS